MSLTTMNANMKSGAMNAEKRTAPTNTSCLRRQASSVFPRTSLLGPGSYPVQASSVFWDKGASPFNYAPPTTARDSG